MNLQDQNTRCLEHIDLGLMPYHDAFLVQQALHKRVIDDNASGFLVTVEHPPCLTMGKHADSRYLHGSATDFQALGVDLVHTDRGGEVTAHEPGQLVVYPILPIQEWKLRPKSYVDRLLQVVIRTLADFGIDSVLDDTYPGVWVETRKICAIGVRIKHRVSYHGLALNVTNSLQLFQSIVPCGIEDPVRSVTSVQLEQSSKIELAMVRECFLSYFQEQFAVKIRDVSSQQLLANLDRSSYDLHDKPLA